MKLLIGCTSDDGTSNITDDKMKSRLVIVEYAGYILRGL